MNPEELLIKKRNTIEGRTFDGVNPRDHLKLGLLFNPVARMVQEGKDEHIIRAALMSKGRLSQRGANSFYLAVKKALEEERK